MKFSAGLLERSRSRLHVSSFSESGHFFTQRSTNSQTLYDNKSVEAHFPSQNSELTRGHDEGLDESAFFLVFLSSSQKERKRSHSFVDPLHLQDPLSPFPRLAADVKEMRQRCAAEEQQTKCPAVVWRPSGESTPFNP